MRKIHLKYITYRQLGALAPVTIRDSNGKLLDRIYTGQEVTVHTDASGLKIRSYLLGSKIDLHSCGEEVYAIIFVKFREHPLLKLLDLGLSNYLTLAIVDREDYEAFTPESYHEHDLRGKVKPYYKASYAVLSAAWVYVALFHNHEPNTRELVFLLGLGNLVGALLTLFRKEVIIQNERFKWMASGVLGMVSGLVIMSSHPAWGLALTVCFAALFYLAYRWFYLVGLRHVRRP